mmetsp:Transcript_60925/g.176245  ORF Transcript_60925/g.176245 Transcript_60925/m.176245 type:complete len:236 (-) Transcript_60925:1052-1759(-)
MHELDAALQRQLAVRRCLGHNDPAPVRIDAQPHRERAARGGRGLVAQRLVIPLAREVRAGREPHGPGLRSEGGDWDALEHGVHGALRLDGQVPSGAGPRQVRSLALVRLEVATLGDGAAPEDEVRLLAEGRDASFRRRGPRGVLQPRLPRLPGPLDPHVVHAVAVRPTEARRGGHRETHGVLLRLLRPALADLPELGLRALGREVVAHGGVEQVPLQGIAVAAHPRPLHRRRPRD